MFLGYWFRFADGGEKFVYPNGDVETIYPDKTVSYLEKGKIIEE